jgi:hypothetical protein
MRRILVWLLTALSLAAQAQPRDPLPSWNEGAAKKSIVDFVKAVTRKGGKDYVAPPERIATFDNDGTLWAEQPLYFQLLFALDRVKALAPQHPEWKDKEPFASLLKGDVKAALSGGERAMMEIVMATHGQTFAAAGSISETADLWDAIVGVRGRVKLAERWFLPYYLDVGAGSSKLTWQALAGIGYAFGWGDVTLAWRQLSYDQKDDKLLQDFRFKGSLLGATFRF